METFVNMCKKKNTRLWILAILMFIVLCIPYAVSALFVVYSGDDYSFYRHVQENGILGNVYNFYMTWQGTYSSTFLVGVLLNIARGVAPLRIESFLIAIIFFITLFIFVFKVLGKILPSEVTKGHVAILSSVTCFFCVYSISPSEILYWHTGIGAYTIPFICGMWTLIIIISDKSKKLVVVSAILAFIAVGGPLQIVGYICGSILAIIIFEYIEGEINKDKIIVFCISLIGGIINLLAPGNYVRKGSDGSDLLILGAARVSIQDCIEQIFCDVNSGMILLIIAVTFIVAVNIKACWKCDISCLKLALIIAVWFVVVVASNYPVELGYGCTGLSPRGVFIERIIYGSFLPSVCLVCWLLLISLYETNDSMKVVGVIFIMIAISLCVSNNSKKSIMPVWMYAEIINGDMAEFAKDSKHLLDIIENSNSQDVIVDMDRPNGQGIVLDIGLNDDAEWWVNRTVASYYGKNSVKLLMESN